MKKIIIAICILLFIACDKSKSKSSELITLPEMQQSIFKDLLDVVQEDVPPPLLSDSLSFLVLPVQASCPACRKKTVDSIMAHRNNLAANQFIIIAATGGRKLIQGYFTQQDYKLPDI